MSLTAMDFAKKHKLIIEEEAPRAEGTLGAERQILAKLDRGRAAAVFTLQLGPLWQGVDKLNAQTKALFVVFAARANGDRARANQLLEQLARGYDSKKNTTNFEGFDKLAHEYVDSKVAKRVLGCRAYVTTVMMAMLQAARYDGVFPASDFLWLKPVDRKLWFLLNTVGRQVPFVEVAGPFAQAAIEDRLGRKVFVPMIDAAVDGLEEAMSEIIYHPAKGDH